ncbi:endonuclease [Microbacterium phage Pikmin]|uniref:Nuclease n=3 Tax=Pikminvirus pikmin TaxID=2560596 RepID=A0A2P1CKE3_9CAUD|nr:endonuclease [Microbacterium phage Pikmin]AVJ51022.1 nuclease [Microbacterium phage Pajaza]AVJ51169.1 nuclease [Microbacterium phage Pikmin]AVJ51727.1 nuclease [Microbacterium phage Casey]
MALESEIVRRILATLNAIDGVYCLRTHGGAFQLKGTPDILGCAKGRFFAIEAKQRAGLKPSPAQKYILGLFEKAGGRVFVSHDPKAQEVVEWIQSLSQD